MNYLGTTAIGKLCGCTRVWAFNKAREGFFDEFKLAEWHGKHYRFKDCAKLRAQCRAIKADRQRARLPKPRSGMQGVASWHALAMDFDLLRRQIGDAPFETWSVDLINAALGELSGIIQFAGQLQFRRRDLLRSKNR